VVVVVVHIISLARFAHNCTKELIQAMITIVIDKEQCLSPRAVSMHGKMPTADISNAEVAADVADGRRDERRDTSKDDRQQQGRARSGGDDQLYRDETTQGGMDETTTRRDDQPSHFRVKERQFKGQAMDMMSASDVLHFVNAIEPRTTGNCNGCRGECPPMSCVAAPQTGNHPDYNPFGSRKDNTFVS